MCANRLGLDYFCDSKNMLTIFFLFKKILQNVSSAHRMLLQLHTIIIIVN